MIAVDDGTAVLYDVTVTAYAPSTDDGVVRSRISITTFEPSVIDVVPSVITISVRLE
jgi:hypothetical protein